MKDQSIIKVNKLFYKLSSLTSLTSITMMNDILTKQALKISLAVDEGEANTREAKSERDQFLILCFTARGGRRVSLEALQQCFQLAAVRFCQLSSHLHLLLNQLWSSVIYLWAPLERIYEEFTEGKKPRVWLGHVGRWGSEGSSEVACYTEKQVQINWFKMRAPRHV